MLPLYIFFAVFMSPLILFLFAILCTGVWKICVSIFRFCFLSYKSLRGKALERVKERQKKREDTELQAIAAAEEIATILAQEEDDGKENEGKEKKMDDYGV